MDDKMEAVGTKNAPASPQPPSGGGKGSGQQASRQPVTDALKDRLTKESFAPRLPEVTLPKSGGAIRGMGEKFSVAAATGTGHLSIPLPLSPARLTPQLQFSYDSGAGNGVFGFGWSIDLPAIGRKTDKGLPLYDDVGESDDYLFSGAEDLVPVLEAADKRLVRSREIFGVSYQIAYYRPRVEGLFARVERWRDTKTDIVHWRTITRDNVISIFGDGYDSRVFDPADPSRIFEWRVSRTFDDKGNVTAYVYAHEDGAGIDKATAHEANRTSEVRNTQTYLRKILYGNVTPYVDDFTAKDEPALPDADKWMFAVSFDYGDHANAGVDPVAGTWPVRPDPFSTYRAGFEIRTYRRVQRLLFFNNFPTETGIGAYGLTRSLDLAYSDQAAPPDPQAPLYTFLVSITQTGYRNDGAAIRTKSLPPLEFEYTKATLDPAIHSVDRESLGNLPEGVDGARFRWLDLDGEGLAGVLAPSNGAWYYKRNLSASNLVPRPDGGAAMAPLFAPMREVARIPGHGDAGSRQFLTLNGDGMIDVAELSGPEPGFYARTAERDFAPFARFVQLPQIDWHDPNVKFVDLTGDGLADVLITEDGLFTFYTSLGSAGFDVARFVRPPWDEEKGPRIVFADGTDTVFIADMSGDGLNDIVRVRNGETAYWPNLGYGRFGAKVRMDHAPRFDSDDAFDGRRIRLADTDGTGSADVLYVGPDGVHVWFNQSGNAFSAPTLLAIFPAADAEHSVQTVDLLGTGTAYLVWSSPLPEGGAAPLLYVDLMGGVKPHLMTRARNNLGAESRVTYAPSTRLYLDDEKAGRPWLTRLPFPVWMVERVETIDWIGRNRLVSRYGYHHGFFDGLEREFRGFGMVEQSDTEEFREDVQFDDGEFANWSALSSTPPILMRTWFHTGAFIDAGKVSQQYGSEYWLEPALRGSPAADGLSAMRLADSMLPAGLTPSEMREAYRALKGQTLRIEVFDAGPDGLPLGNPYSVTENNFAVVCVQRQGINRHASFFTHPRESITLHYERAAADPRVTHELILQVNGYGDVVRMLSIGYPRRAGPPPEPALDAATQGRLAYDQARLHMRGLARTDTNAIDDIDATPHVYRAPHAAAIDIAEITGAVPSDKGFGAASLFAFEELEGTPAAPGLWQTLWSGAHDVSYEAIPAADVDGTGVAASGPTRRFLAKMRTLYRSDDLATLLPLRQLPARALPAESYQAALTPSHVTAVFGALAPAPLLQEGGYVQLPGESEWWVPSGRVYLSPLDTDTPAQELSYAQRHFFMPRRQVDPFGGVARVAFDAYDLLPVSATDPVGNVISSVNDYRTLTPAVVTDANGNRSAVAYDALGLLVATAVKGKTTENLGDTLDSLAIDLDDATVAAFFTDPIGSALALIGSATMRVVMDIAAYQRTRSSANPLPPAVAVISRETHSADLAPGEVSALQLAVAYNDGLGRIIQHKARVADGSIVEGGPVVAPRWLGSGWTIFNNKGRPVRHYEPFFTATSAFEFAAQAGVSVQAFYDATGRVVATLHPDATWEKSVFDAWRQQTWDRNDTVLITDPRADADVGTYFQRALGATPFTTWEAARMGGGFGPDVESKAAEQDAATKAGAHAATPAVEYFDSLGRACLAIADNGGNARFAARTALDADGKPLAVFDAIGRRAQENVLRVAGGGVTRVAGADMGGRGLYTINADAGARRTLHDVAGKPIRGWDARGQAFRFVYDAGRRPLRRYVSAGGAPEILLELSVYGEGRPADNLCGRMFRHYDGAGYAENTRYDFKGNLVASARQLAAVYKQSPDWSALVGLSGGPALDATAQAAGLIPSGDGGRDRFVGSASFDAHNRPLQTVSPANATMRPNVVQFGYDVGGELTTLDIWLQQVARPAGLLDAATADRRAVAAIDYNGRGQCVAITYGNGVIARYQYDPLTFRLRRLTSVRPASFGVNQQTVQDLRYFYDPVGNVTRIRDDADIQNVIYFSNQRVEPSNDCTYDPLYRLVAASGREHLGQTGGALKPAAQVGDDDSFRIRLPQPGDGTAMGTYLESYAYDAVGNILSMAHQVASGGWTRRYAYREPSRIIAGETGNRLSSTTLPGDPAGGPFSATYDHDAHGNWARAPHLPTMTWNEDDRLVVTTRTVGASPPTTYYAYGAGGIRARKIAENPGLKRVSERIYLGAVEVYREFAADGTGILLSRETFSVDAGGQIALRAETRTIGTDFGPAQQVRYQYANHLGSATLELGDAGEVISYEEYFPFGATSYQAVLRQTDVPKRYRYTGKERDEENGFSYHGARYYAPWLGRWTACDPGGMIDGPNLYLYASDRPTSLVDRNGMKATAGHLSPDAHYDPENHPEDYDKHQTWPTNDPLPPVPPDRKPPTFCERFAGAMRSLGEALGRGVAAVGRGLSAAWRATKSAVTTAAHAVKGAIITAAEKTRDALITASRAVANAAVRVGRAIAGAVVAAGRAIAGAAVTAAHAIARAAVAAGRAIAGAAVTAWEKTTAALKKAWEATKSAFKAAGHWLYEAASTVWDSIPFRILGHLTWGLPGTLIGGALSLFNLTIGNVITAIHNIATDDAHDWDYASVSLGGPKDSNPVIGNYGGIFNLGGIGAAVTIGPFVFFEGAPAGGQSVRDRYANRPAEPIYNSKENLTVSDHEKGHTDQNLLYGPLTPIFGLVFSLLPNALGAGEDSGWFWFDRQANQFSGRNNPFHPNTRVHP